MNFAEQLKSQLNIVDVVGQYVRLKRQGAGPRYVGLCPFHSEKTPSFGVNSALQYYKCFGCEAGGNVFNFVMEHDRLTFPEALKTLAERYGIPMPMQQRDDDPAAREYSALLEMHEMAAELFQENLRGAKGKEAMEYLAKRGVSTDAISEFRMGLSDRSGQELVQHLQKYGAALMEKSGLVARRQESAGFYDRFRGRLMFPIHSESGKVIGFGGRALRQGDEPKYLNSPETPIYKKSLVLYNLHRAKINARKHDRMVLVEGYLDVVGVYSAGVQEVVASSGTALSTDQVRTIKRQISQTQAVKGTIVLNFDPDEAGAKSTEKYIGTVLAEGLRVRVLQIPGNLDPDEYIQKQGAGDYLKLLEHAGSYFHWLADRARSKFDMRSPEGRVDAFKSLVPALQLVRDWVERGAIANDLADYLRVDRDVVRESLRRLVPGESSHHLRAVTAIVHPNEKLLIACLLASTNARAAIREYLRHSADMLPVLELKEIFEAVLAADDGGESFSLDKLMAMLEGRAHTILIELSFSDLGVDENDAPQQALHCLEALEWRASRKQSELLKRQIRDAEHSGDLHRALQLTETLNRLQSGTQKA